MVFIIGGTDFALNPELDFDTTMNDFIENLTQKIPLDMISNFDALRERIGTLLEMHGFGERGPECHLEVSLSGRTIITKLKQVGGGKSILLNEDRITVDETVTRTSLLDSFFDMEFGGLNVTNRDDFIQNLESFIDELGLSDD